MRKSIVLSALCICSLSALAELTSEEILNEITDNISFEYMECGAYFSIVSGGLVKSGSKETAEKYKSASDNAMQFALIASEKSRSKEMAQRVTLARFQLSLEDMQKTIERNYRNISLLSSKYSESCTEAMTNSAAFMERWAEKITSKYRDEQRAKQAN